ncbi:MAG: ABC transporter substrate-binding protein [Actinomycetia bacterium]|nr:ABC transporter substrate-binding protein [Actinomycetes bacterium]
MSRERVLRHRLAALVMGSVLVATACTSTSEATETAAPAPVDNGVFVGADGVATTVGDTSRIVSLTGDITEIIFELGLGESVVAVDITTTYPPEAEDLKSSGSNVGFGQALAAESVLRYEPTLVLGDQSIAPTETIEQLRNAGIPVIILKYQTTLEGVEEKINQVAAILGVPQDGEELAGNVMAQVAAAQERAAGADAQPRVAYLYTRGPSVLLLFGQGIPTQAMIEGAGAIDVGAALGDGAIPLTPEALISAMPDVIVLPESGVKGLGGIDALLEIPGIAETPAGQNRAFLAYDEAYFFNLGPRVGSALDEFVDDLYPQLSD